VSFDPRFTAAVGTRIPGLVRSVAHFEGDLVKAGEALAVVEGAELGAAQADVLSLRAHEQAAGSSFDREEGLGARGLSSARRREAAAARYSVLQSKRIAAEQRVTALGGARSATVVGVHRLRSPIAGTIVERHVNAGQSVDDHRIAFRVANLDHLWVELSVAEPQVRGVSSGDRVEVCATAIALECVKGSVAHVGEQVDPANLVVTVRVEVDNSARKLRAGQAVTAKIRPSGVATEAAVVVPRSAVVRVDGQPLVFVATVDRRIIPTKVELAESNESEQRIASGISAGQTIVSEGAPALTRALFR
jgi:cobalt-zinc-cadmium efflux system membrane fusion protein